MKRIALLGLACFTLFGCGDDSGGKVTNEFLVGKWDCVNKKYESNYDSKMNKYSDYVESSSSQIIQSYKVVNGVLLSKTGDEDGIELDLDKFYNNLTTKGNSDDCEYTTIRNLVKNSSNGFTFEMEMIFNCSYENNLLHKFKIKRDIICTRIK
ncbi:hypothetical protein H3T80_08295 [Gilliamella sp. W8145]|uniref:hypothetical protein n=1 Tax=Gilliamella sp. W8145 TaxID=2750990 RepID=UPI0018DEA5BC|nr:hypothetical protein [Gilliamella sp. W8145]MBI0104145.1 hypothetical protein [Gilliamella sp. W8145]